MEIRVDYLKSETIVYSQRRSKRPHNYNINKAQAHSFGFSCPFCQENKNQVGELVFENEFGSRIVKNLYPVVDGELGIHDVAIESYEHDLQLKDMSHEHVLNFLLLLQNRYADVSSNEFIKNVQAFKNNGPISGATLEHSHWQIVSTNFIPRKTQLISDNFTKFLEETGSCFLCSENEIIKLREDRHVVMGVPKAACGNINFRIFSKRHVKSFVELNTEELSSIANDIIFAATAISKLREIVSFNILFFSEPIGKQNEDFHFFIDILDRKGTFGGFELSTGEFLNSVLPEEMYEEIKKIMEV